MGERLRTCSIICSAARKYSTHGYSSRDDEVDGQCSWSAHPTYRRPGHRVRQCHQYGLHRSTYEAAGAAAAVIEDKTFPKDSSLRTDGRQKLVSIEEFQGKIAAAKAASSMLVIARTEALIADLGEEEALKRGMAYVEAGADAILIHSKKKTPDEILSFCRAWPGKVPLVIVPTSYPQITFAEIGKLNKFGLVICGNHAIRASVAAMKHVFRRILKDGGIAGVEEEIATVSEVFELQGDEWMRELERKYLP